ncbi:hypothetical protein B0H17DRAFT_1130453 [Mycena rosella]|uniref:Uncharacterized protein n=1 Tax=Mycena rosella TaxID=1033263 RepID=A0AAD7GLX8_MYCRO|nr:hypothetical protein B0H17DRAFT_1130453 [Mycena rosella]
MPPKGSGNLREEDFRYNEARTEVQCKICAAEGVPTWIAVKSATRHLTYPAHSQAVALAEDRRRRLECLERERESDSATNALREIWFATPVAAASTSSRVTSDAEAEMWEAYRINGADFSAGEITENREAQQRQLCLDTEVFGLWNPDAMARKLGFGAADSTLIEDDPEDDFLAEIMGNVDLRTPEPDEIQSALQDFAPGVESNPWFPYPTKMVRMFLLDTLDNLPRLRISSSLMRVILWVLKEGNCKDVPSFDHLRRVQKTIRVQCEISSIPCKSVQGNVFFMNDPKAIIAQDWSNPATRKFIHVYPEIPEDGIIREIWHAKKWRKDMDLDILSPMYDAGVSHYYVNEVARLRDGSFVVPIRWVKFRGKVYADAYSVVFNDAGEATIVDSETSLICSEDLVNNYHDLEAAGKIPTWGVLSIEAGYPDRMPNPKRIIAAGQQFREFQAAVEVTHTEPVEVQDELGNVSCFCLHVNAGPSDNPMQSEVSGHIGGKGNCFCRKCRVGGTQNEKATNEGYHTLFEAGAPCTKGLILEELEKQVKLGYLGVAKHVKDSQTETGVKDTYTQFWIDELLTRFKQMKKDQPTRSVQEIQEELIQWTVDNRDKSTVCFDPTKDTPIEILHTILLGVIKYIWHITHTPWSAEQKQIYSHRLQSTNTDGLSIHAIRSNYIMQYAGSLIGRQFKTIAQTNIFHVRDLVTDDQFSAWKAAGELAALLWFPEIRNLDDYRRDLKVAVANILDIFATIDPSKIVTKPKYHLLVHIDEDVVQFGPLVGVATETFEAFNGVFRYCSILSNHLAPSRDIALQLADQEGLKHRLTGGRWRAGEDRTWTRAGSGVRHFMADHPILQRLVGWTEHKVLKHGEVKLVSVKRGQKERESYTLKSTSAARASNYGLHSPESTWSRCIYVISESLDECRVDSWVFAKSPSAQDSSVISGRISDILVNSAGVVLVVLERFQVLSSRDEMYGMPVLLELIVSSEPQVQFNVQHDCHSAKFGATGVRFRMQERVESGKTENYIVHASLARFIINTHAFHNAHLLRATLPRDLIAPIPLFPDREAKHHELAAQLREQVASRKAAAATKKRKRSQADEDSENEAEEERPRKARKGAKRRKNAEPVPPSGSMVATRTRRIITQTERAKAAQELDSEDEGEDNSEASDDVYDGSDGEYSD